MSDCWLEGCVQIQENCSLRWLCQLTAPRLIYELTYFVIAVSHSALLSFLIGTSWPRHCDVIMLYPTL